MHQTTDLKVQYFGTPVVLISTRNPDGTANLAPMSSAWWLNGHCMLGMNTGAQTTINMLRERECVLNLPSPDLAGAVDRLALLTGSPELSPHKIEKGYRYEPDKFGTAGLTPLVADLADAPLVAECPVQLECELAWSGRLDPGERTTALAVRVLRAHVDSDLIVPGTGHIDPVKWDPLIMKFCEFFGGGTHRTGGIAHSIMGTEEPTAIHFCRDNLEAHSHEFHLFPVHGFFSNKSSQIEFLVLG